MSSPLPRASHFLVQIQFLRTCSERPHSSPFQGPASGQRFPGASLTTVHGLDPLESVSSCLGLKQVFCPSQMGTSGRLSAPTSSHSRLSEEQNPPCDHRPPPATPGCQPNTQGPQAVLPAEPQSMLPPPGRRRAREREVGVCTLPITPSFSSSKTHLLTPPLGSLIFAWLYISGDIWAEIARKRL